VVDLVKKLYKKAQTEEERDVETLVDSSSGTGDDDEEQSETEQSGDSIDDRSTDKNESDSDGNESSSDEDGDETENASLTLDENGEETTLDDDGGEPNLPKGAETDQHFEENLSSLVDDDARERAYGKIPNIESDDYIVNLKEFHSGLETTWNTISNLSQKSTTNFIVRLDKEYNKFRQDNIKVVNFLVKEFELKKNAQQYARATTSRTGVLDVNKIHGYKFNEDLFRKMTVVPDGKNHGLIFFVDWSGSIHHSIGDILKQVLQLAWFCKKVNIPFEVYAFTDRDTSTSVNSYNYEHGDLLMGEFSLLNLISSKSIGNLFNRVCRNIFLLSEVMTTAYWHLPTNFQLGSTPLNETLVVAHDLVPKFKDAYGLEIVNTVFLTDGDSNGNSGLYDTSPENSSHVQMFRIGSQYSYSNGDWKENSSFLIDKVTKITYEIRGSVGLTNALINSLQDRHGINVIGFFVAPDKHTLTYALSTHCPESFEDTGGYKRIINPEVWKKFRKDRYLVLDEHDGYDEFYIIGASKEKNTTLDDVDETSKRKLTTAFKKITKGNLTNKVILTRFVDLIS